MSCCVALGMEPGLLEEQLVLLTAELSLQPPEEMFTGHVFPSCPKGSVKTWIGHRGQLASPDTPLAFWQPEAIAVKV